MSGTGTVHIIGAGLAGLSTALRLADHGLEIVIHEAAAQAGGRCRSYFDPDLGCRIDNGNHLLVSGNRSVAAYLATIGATDSLTGPREAEFPFLDLATGERWVVTLSHGVVPVWIFDPNRRVPGTRARDYLAALRLARARDDATVERVLGGTPALYRRFWEPLAVAVLNTEADRAAARPLWPVLRETFARGGAYCRPLIVKDGLSESFIDPALAWLAARGVTARFGARVRAIDLEPGRAAALRFTEDAIELGPSDCIVLAVPPAVAASLLPGLVVPEEYRPIVNVHFRLSGEALASGDVAMLGLLGGTAEWLFRRGDIASVTVSAATTLFERPAEEIAARSWRDVARALGRSDAARPPWRVVKEKRATIAQTPVQLRRRPPARTTWRNLFLAGDWTDTGLPATIEGAIRSGERAAQCLLGNSPAKPL